jgi:hypothetical protein
MIDAVLEQPVNWQSMSTDDAFRHKIQLDDLAKQRDKLKDQVNQKWQAHQQQSAQSMQELKAAAMEVVSKRIPGWNDAVAKATRDFAVKEGFSEAEVDSIVEPRHAVTLWKAMQYDQLQAKATPAVTQARALKTTSAKPMSPATKDYLNYRKAVSKHEKGTTQHQAIVKDRIASIFSR